MRELGTGLANLPVFSAFLRGNIRWINQIIRCLKCSRRRFDLHVHCDRIHSIDEINTPSNSHIYLFFLIRTCKLYFLRKFYLYDTELSAVRPKLYTRASALIHLLTEILKMLHFLRASRCLI